MSGVLITPHVVGAGAGFSDRAWRLVADQVRRYMRGARLRNIVADGY
jgi:phosphoglycerate dehydrogenase-like enzyme